MMLAPVVCVLSPGERARMITQPPAERRVTVAVGGLLIQADDPDVLESVAACMNAGAAAIRATTDGATE